MRFQNLFQIPVFCLFILLLWLAAYPLATQFEVDWFLRMDPLISVGTMAAARSFIPSLAWAFIVLGVTLFLGRLFCGYLCPMGATLDFVDWMNNRKKKGRKQNSFEASGKYRNLKYLALFFIIGTSLVGISSVFFLSPLSLITRFYSFVIYPIILMLTNLFLDTFRPVFPFIGLERLSFVYYKVPAFNTNLFIASMAFGIMLLGLVQRRFWCRNLCPAGAIQALFSLKPLFRRSVSDQCTRCGRCVPACPMGAIGEDYVTTAHSECLTCLKCRDICPEAAISFKITRKAPAPDREIDLSRRKVLSAGVSGIATAAVTMTGLRHLHGGDYPRALRPEGLIRPPGALPEPEFQARCVRCGECMKGCLTNTLQPVWIEAGLSGLWTPKITARLDGCEQNCNACGYLCPTGAIRPLNVEEKIYAKVGTARIIQTRCIAWEQDMTCLICDEICPYNAISSRFVSGHPVTVPVVDENKCNGCGYCEAKCPVIGDAAIVVEPKGELRLMSGSYQQKALELGLVFHAKTSVEDQFILAPPSGINSGLEDRPADPKGEPPDKLPPGFIIDD
jgi:MauM/NapG family ferredoxin protein